MSLIAEAFVRIRPVVDPTFNRQVEQQIKPGLRKVEQSLQGSNREIGRFNRGALVGTGALGGLGRAAAFASTSFIGGAGLVFALKSTVSAAEESQKVQAQLANALDAQNISFSANRAAIDRRTQALSQMSGFDDELITTTFINFVRRTGDVTKALNLNAIAVNVARGRNISLEASSALVTRASLGMAGALRRVGIAAQDGASASELLDLLQRKYAGSALAYGKTAVGAQERFQVALENTQEVIGAAVLPALTKALGKATDFLNNSKNQQKIQQTVTTATKDGADAFDVLAASIGGAKRAWDAWTAVARKLPGDDQHGFFRTLLTGTIFAQFKSFEQANYDLARALHLMGSEASKASTGVETVGQAVGKAFQAQLGINPDLTFFERPTGVVPAHVQGGAFLGFPITAAQRRAEALAKTSGTGTPSEVAAANAQIAADNKALAFARGQIAAGRGNLKNFETQIISLEGDRRSLLDRIASIAAANLAAAAANRAKRKAALEAFKAKRVEDFQSNLEDVTLGVETSQGGGLGLDLAAATKAGAERAAARAQALTNIPRALDLREQIAEATFMNEKKLIPFLQAEVTAVKHNLSILQKTGQFKNDQLQATLTIAQLNRRIRDIRKQDKKDSAFSVQDLFTEGASEFARYGSNVAPLTQPLSPQEAGGAVVRGARSMVVTQNFFGERSAAQALQGAAQAARALRYG